MATITEKTVPETHRNKVGIYDETRDLLKQINENTGIPRARIVHDAVSRYARNIRSRRRTPTAA